MRVELRRIDDDGFVESLDVDRLSDVPHPGRWIDVGERCFLVMQRRHCYQLRQGGYELVAVVLQVKPEERPADARRWRHGWVIGDPHCLYNACSPLLRCAVLPDGPCERCIHFTPRLG